MTGASSSATTSTTHKVPIVFHEESIGWGLTPNSVSRRIYWLGADAGKTISGNQKHTLSVFYLATNIALQSPMAEPHTKHLEHLEECSNHSRRIFPENLMIAAEYGYDSLIPSGDRHRRIPPPPFESEFQCSVVSESASINHDQDEQASSVIKAKIASHPSYPKLLDAYIDCQKVGAPPEIAYVLEEIRREKVAYKQDEFPICFGDDPELDEFMETYCDILVKYKTDLSRPFDEATSFLKKNRNATLKSLQSTIIGKL